jgi:hypothetical protein
LRLDIEPGLHVLPEIFPAAPDAGAACDYAEPAPPREGAAYVREHEEIFAPMRRLFDLVREIATAITQEVRAFGRRVCRDAARRFIDQRGDVDAPVETERPDHSFGAGARIPVENVVAYRLVVCSVSPAGSRASCGERRSPTVRQFECLLPQRDGNAGQCDR